MARQVGAAGRMRIKEHMRRREFISSLLKLTGSITLSGLFAGCLTGNRTMASVEKTPIMDQAGKLSLRELVENKIHHGNERFVNPFNERGHKSFLTLLWWKIFDENRFRDLYDQERVTPVHIDWRPVREHGGCAVTFIRHSTLLIKDADRILLIDPVFKSPFMFKDFSPLALDVREIPSPDHILVTHGHYDHMHMGTLSLFDADTHVITPLGYRRQFKALKMSRHTQLDWFDSFKENKREIICLPCNHWTMRNPLIGPNRDLWGSFLIRTKSGVSIYISGDTAYFSRFHELAEEYSIDLAIFNLGAYEPRWFMADSHINPAETVKAFHELEARRLMIVHWGAFRLGDEPVFQPPLDIKREMEKEGLARQLLHLNPGQTLFYNKDINNINIL